MIDLRDISDVENRKAILKDFVSNVEFRQIFEQPFREMNENPIRMYYEVYLYCAEDKFIFDVGYFQPRTPLFCFTIACMAIAAKWVECETYIKRESNESSE